MANIPAATGGRCANGADGHRRQRHPAGQPPADAMSDEEASKVNDLCKPLTCGPGCDCWCEKRNAPQEGYCWADPEKTRFVDLGQKCLDSRERLENRLQSAENQIVHLQRNASRLRAALAALRGEAP